MTKTKIETLAAAPLLKEVAAEPPVESEDSSTSDESGPTPTSSSVNSNDDVPPTVIEDEGRKKMESLKDRGRIPNSFWVTVVLIAMLEGCSGMYKMDTLRSWWSSFTTSIYTIRDLLQYEKDLMWSVVSGDLREPMEYLQATIVTVLAGSILWVLIGKPMAAGLWTGQRAARHKVHRYMGLFFLTQYTLAWVEFITNYKGAGAVSFLPHTVALNGMFWFPKM
jgi:hypothetical protein